MLDLRPTSAGYIYLVGFVSQVQSRVMSLVPRLLCLWLRARVRSKESPEQLPFEAVSPWLLFRAVHVQQLGLSSLVELVEDMVERVNVAFQVLVGGLLLVGYQWTLCPHHLEKEMTSTCPAKILLVANMPIPLPMPASFITMGG